MKVRFNGIRAVHKLCHLGKGGGSPENDLLHNHYLKKDNRGVRGVKSCRFRETTQFMDGPIPPIYLYLKFELFSKSTLFQLFKTKTCCNELDFFSQFKLDFSTCFSLKQGLRTPREEIAFTARPKIHSHAQIFRYGRSIFCLPHRLQFSDILDLCLHWVSVVRGLKDSSLKQTKNSEVQTRHLTSIFFAIVIWL